MNDSSPTRSSKISPTRSRSNFAALVLLTLSAASLLAQTETLPENPTRDRKVVKRWNVGGDPRGVAVGRDGTIYVGLAESQSVLAVDPKTGAVKKRAVLDSAEIAATKELVTLRVTADGKRLVVANGSDESATILSLPDLGPIREITTEGEPIRDAVPDPAGKYLYLLGRRVHVYDYDGQTELRTLAIKDPMAIAVTSNGGSLAVLAPENFGNTTATVVALYETNGFTELARDPLQTEQVIEGALFAADDRALVAVSREYLFEKPVVMRPSSAKTMSAGTNGQMRMKIDFGDLVNSDRVCMPEGAGPQIITRGSGNMLILAERRCSASGTFSGSDRRVTPASLYGVNAYALAFDAPSSTLIATDRAGTLTIYRVPRAAVAR